MYVFSSRFIIHTIIYSSFLCFTLLLIPVYPCWKPGIFYLLYIYEFSYEKRKASLLCSLQRCLLGDLTSFSFGVLASSGTNKRKLKINRRELQSSSRFFNWKQRTNCSIWLRWHLFIAYCSFGNELYNPLVQNALIFLDRTADKEAWISQGFKTALGCTRMVHPFTAAGRETCPEMGWLGVSLTIISGIK